MRHSYILSLSKQTLQQRSWTFLPGVLGLQETESKSIQAFQNPRRELEQQRLYSAIRQSKSQGKGDTLHLLVAERLRPIFNGGSLIHHSAFQKEQQ